MNDQLSLSVISHELDGRHIQMRATDGYINATAMCMICGKSFTDYNTITTTTEFLSELAKNLDIQTHKLMTPVRNSYTEQNEIWVHPDVAIHLGQWLSPKFAVAVSRWVREWFSGKWKPKGLPYHLNRYMSNRTKIPYTHWSMLNELTMALVAPLESYGYRLPEKMVPDISEGRMFCKWLREEKGINTDLLKTYNHEYEDGRIVQAKLYPNSLLEEFRRHFYEEWLPNRSVKYFSERDEVATPFLKRLIKETEK